MAAGQPWKAGGEGGLRAEVPNGLVKALGKRAKEVDGPNSVDACFAVGLISFETLGKVEVVWGQLGLGNFGEKVLQHSLCS